MINFIEKIKCYLGFHKWKYHSLSKGIPTVNQAYLHEFVNFTCVCGLVRCIRTEVGNIGGSIAGQEHVFKDKDLIK